MTVNDPSFSAAFWDQHYRSTGQAWSGEPNIALVEEVSGLAPGTALDVGCGEGAEAIWLAGRGWQVTAVDFSAPALERAAGHTPADLAGRTTWRQDNVRDWRPEEAPLYDLVTASYLVLPVGEARRVAFVAMAARVAPGGRLVLIGEYSGGLPLSPGLFHVADGLGAGLPDRSWTVITRAVRPRAATSPDGAPAIVHDTVFSARRTR